MVWQKIGLLLAICSVSVCYAIDDEIFIAVEKGDLPKVKSLVEKGAKVSVEDEHSSPLFHYAFTRSVTKNADNQLELSKSGNFELVKYLVSQGAGVNGKNEKDGVMPLHCAAYLGDILIFRYLVNRGANIEAPNKYGARPLHYAVYAGNLPIVAYLVESGVDFLCENSEKQKPVDSTSRQDIKNYLGSCEKFKAGDRLEIKNQVHKLLTDKGSIDANIELLSRVALLKDSYLDLVYNLMRTELKEVPELADKYVLESKEDFCLNMLRLCKDVPEKLLLALCERLFKLCKKPLHFGSEDGCVSGSFESRLKKRIKAVFPSTKTLEDSHELLVCDKIKQLYNKKYLLPARLADMRNRKFVDIVFRYAK